MTVHLAMDAAELVPAAAVEAEVGEGVGGGVEWHGEGDEWVCLQM